MNGPVTARRIGMAAVFCIALAIPLALWSGASHSAGAALTLDDARAEAVRGGYRLIDFEHLRERLEREPGRLLFVDTRQDWEYRAGHIPDAINFSFEPTLWARLKNRWALNKALGADKTRPLIFY